MKHSWKRLVSVMLAVAMAFGLAVPAFAANDRVSAGSQSVTWEKVDNDSVSFSLPRQEMEQLRDEPQYADDDVVRVSIILDKPSALEKGIFTGRNVLASGVMNYRAGLENDQTAVAANISRYVLRGRTLDVVWRMTLIANLISANVPYGAIEDIKDVRGVQNVVLETRYEPASVERDELNPQMSNAGQMTGGVFAHAAGYTGAGSKVAIIDTGLDTEHELFDAKAFDQAIKEDNAARKEAGKDPVVLMTKKDVKNIWSNLHASEFLSSEKNVYRSTKIPFAVNYVDQDLDVEHVNDNQGEHGSHVAGIAVGNRYVMRGKTAVPSLDEVLTQGEAPDAQIMVMKVFGKGGGAYDSDYMVAIEDAVTMGADAINLSLGSSAAGQAVQSPRLPQRQRQAQHGRHLGVVAAGMHRAGLRIRLRMRRAQQGVQLRQDQHLGTRLAGVQLRVEARDVPRQGQLVARRLEALGHVLMGEPLLEAGLRMGPERPLGLQDLPAVAVHQRHELLVCHIRKPPCIVSERIIILCQPASRDRQAPAQPQKFM